MGRGVYWYFVLRIGVLDVVSVRERLEKLFVEFSFGLVVSSSSSSFSFSFLLLISRYDVNCDVSSTPKTVVYRGVFISVPMPPRLIVYFTR